MKKYKYQIVWPFLIGVLLILGCSAKSPNVLRKDSEKSPAKLIAVLPVENKTPDVMASRLLRSKVFDELYFKGYSKFPLEVIDKKLELLYNSDKKNSAGVVAPGVIKELTGADAVMYCTLTEGKSKLSFIYAPVTIAARCELRSTQTGEVVWNGQHKLTSRNFDLPGKRLEMKSYEVYETVINEVVNKVLETLPDGPNLKG